MKKLLAVCIAALLLSVPVFADASDFTGDWYGEIMGMVLKMTFNEDGTYVMDIAGEPQEGTWEETDDGILVDGDSKGVLTDEGLEITDQDDMTMVFGREEIEAFIPAEIDYEAELDDLQGKWSAYKFGADGSYIDVAPDDMYAMDLEIEGQKVTMNGFYFDNETIELEMQDGGLSRFADDESEMFEIIAINRLEDGTLRLALVPSVEDGEQMEYLFVPAEEVEEMTETEAA